MTTESLQDASEKGKEEGVRSEQASRRVVWFTQVTHIWHQETLL